MLAKALHKAFHLVIAFKRIHIEEVKIILTLNIVCYDVPGVGKVLFLKCMLIILQFID